MTASSSTDPTPHSPSSASVSRAARWLETSMWVIPLMAFGFFANMLPAIADGSTIRWAWQWVPSLDVQFSLLIDGLSLLFALLITGIGTLIFLYAPGYMGEDPDRFRLYAWLLVFMVAMLGVVLADNVIAMFVFWELTSLASYMLIGYGHDDAKSRAAALQALLVTGLGGLGLLAGLVLLGIVANTLELSAILGQGPLVQNSPLYQPLVVLILLGIFTKSAQFPFHFWLPSAMAAPTPVSAYLHSATMVKAGIYLAARLHPAFVGSATWEYPLLLFGGLTAVLGAVLALAQVDLKRVLAYSTVSTLGTLTMLLGLGTALALQTAALLLLVHSLYKGALFLTAGTVDHATGTRDIRRLKGLASNLPWLAAAAFLAGMSLIGFPPTGGFLSKELVYETSLHLSWGATMATAVLWFVNGCLVAVAGMTVWIPFFGKSKVDVDEPNPEDPSAANDALLQDPAESDRLANEIEAHHVPSWRMVFPPLLLGALGLPMGFFGKVLGEYLVHPVAAAMGAAEMTPIKLWHGISGPLLLSVATLILGVATFLAIRPRIGQNMIGNLAANWGPAAGYEAALSGLKYLAAWQTRILQNGKLRVYLLVFISVFVFLVGRALAKRLADVTQPEWMDWSLYELFIPVLIVAATLLTVIAASRLTAVCAVGAIGYAVAMLFVLYGSPDLAMTQVAIETLTVILFVLVIYRLPKFARLSSFGSRVRDAVVAVAAGSVMAAVTLAATFAHAPSRLTPYFAANSLEAAKGRNIVNVILVDFRGLDTLGEITVLAVAALGIFALMRIRTPLEVSQATSAED